MAPPQVAEVETELRKNKTVSLWARISTIGLAMMLVCGLALYIAISPVVARTYYYQFLFLAKPYPSGYYDNNEVVGVKAEDIYFNAGKERLHGWFFKKKDAKRVVLMHHGNGGNISILQWYVDLFLRSDCSVLVYDYEGYGKSTGTPSITAVCKDSEAAFDFLVKTREYKPESIVNFGLSLGTGAATQVAANHNCAGLILIAPYTSLWKTSRHVFPWLQAYPDPLFPEHDLDSVKPIAKVKAPILCFHGVNDEMIPSTDSESLKKEAKAKFTLVSLNCGHGDLGHERETILESIKNFVKALN